MRLIPLAALATAAAFAGAACSSAQVPTAPTTPPVTQAPTPDPDPEPVPEPDPVARYLVTFNSTWSRETHPDDWPEDAHYSGLIGGTHTANVTFWQDGQPASAGIQAMAEQGRKSPLDLEVMAAMSAGTAQHLLSGPNLSDSPDMTTMEFEISVEFPLVTLVTMVAPSPDWFVGVSGLSLLVNGQWTDELSATLFPWDAGTDSGDTYEADNSKTIPVEPIRRLLGFPVAVNGNVAPFGTMTFKRLM